MGWLTTLGDHDVIRAYWPSCDEVPDDELALLLASAQAQCAEYAPALAADAPVPDAWRHAQTLQARALYRSGISGAGDQIGMDGVSVTVFPLDWTVKRLLRPQKGTLWVK